MKEDDDDEADGYDEKVHQDQMAVRPLIHLGHHASFVDAVDMAAYHAEEGLHNDAAAYDLDIVDVEEDVHVDRPWDDVDDGLGDHDVDDLDHYLGLKTFHVDDTKDLEVHPLACYDENEMNFCAYDSDSRHLVAAAVAAILEVSELAYDMEKGLVHFAYGYLEQR